MVNILEVIPWGHQIPYITILFALTTILFITLEFKLSSLLKILK